MGKLPTTCLLRLTLCTTANASVNYRGCAPQRPSKVPMAPMGKLLTLLPRLSLARTLRSTTASTCHRDLQNFPSPPWETHILLVVCRAAVSLSREAQWLSRRAPSVGTQLHMCTLMLKSSHLPDWKMADVLASTLARTTAADAPVNYSVYVP